MNFFAHACLANEVRPEPSFVFGAMLPDFAAMAGLRVASVAHTVADDGRRFHHATDALFHRAERFRSLCRAGTRSLSGAGVRRGTARAIAHVGIELLLDDWIAAEQGVPACYGEALALAPMLLPAIAFRPASDAERLLELCERIAAAPVVPPPGGEPDRLGTRLARSLARRPRLALLPSELPSVRAWATSARGEVAHAGAELLAAPRAGSGGFRSGRVQSAEPARSPRAWAEEAPRSGARGSASGPS